MPGRPNSWPQRGNGWKASASSTTLAGCTCSERDPLCRRPQPRRRRVAARVGQVRVLRDGQPAADLSCYALLLRDHELLDATLARIADLPAPTGRFLNAEVLRGQACVAAMRGNLSEAAALFRRASDEFRDMGQAVDTDVHGPADRSPRLASAARRWARPPAREARRDPRAARRRCEHCVDRSDDAVRAGPLSAAAGAGSRGRRNRC